MKKIITVAVAAVIASTSLGVASAAEAQSRHNDRYEQRHEQRHDRRDFRREQRHDRREFRQDVRQYERWQRAERRYNAGRYAPPRGYQVRNWSYGQRMPAVYRSRAYVLNDYGRYGLRPPPRGYEYVRSGDDVILTAVATGLITAVIAGMFN